MKKILNKLLSIIGPSILTVLGFSCSNPLNPDSDPNNNPYTGLVMYGTPHCDLKVVIEVVDQSGKPIEGIKVVPAADKEFYGGSDDRSFKMIMGMDTLTTDKNGKVKHTYSVQSVPSAVKVYFEDVDGAKNRGTFAKDSAWFYKIKTGEDNTRDFGWYSGEWTISGKKSLKKK